MLTSTRAPLTISVRRFFVFNFFKNQFARFTDKHSRIIDIGGKKVGKRDNFDLGEGVEVLYVNSDSATQPDVLADAADLPLVNDSFDVAIMGELLEHVPNPQKVITEAHRVLCSGGRLLATVPFMYPVHADPHDYGRYTEQGIRRMLTAADFVDIDIQPQGSWYAVAALAVQAFFRFPERHWLTRRFGKLAGPLVRLLMARDRSAGPTERAWTTGYGITAKKA